MKKRIISFLLVMALVLSMVPAIEIETLAASNLDYIENESGKGEEFELLGYGFNALGNSELDYTTMILRPMLNYDVVEALEISGRITNSTATYATSAQEMMYEFGIDYGNKSSATVPLEVLKIGFKSKFDASLNMSEKVLVDSRLYYYTNETIFRKYVANIYDAGSADILSTEFLKAIDNLNNSTNDAQMTTFFETWGTHMLTSYNSGAFLEYVAYAYSFSEESKLSTDITSEMEMSANVMDISRVDNMHLKLDTMQNTDTLKVKTAWFAYGGDSEKAPSELAQDLTKTQASIDEWTSSLSDDSGVMIPSSTKWMPIWELIPAEYADLKAALQDYYLRQANGVNAAFFSKFTTYSDIKGTTEVFYRSPTGHIFPVTYRSEMSVAPGAKFNVVNLDADLSNVEFQISGPATVEDGVVTVDAGATSGTITVKIVDLDGNQIGSAKTFKVVKEGAGLFAGGYGDEERPYLISSPTEFSNIRSKLNCHYLLLDDISLKSIRPITGTFTGTLDGNGYEISDWEYIQTGVGNIGLFEINLGTIKNLDIRNFKITSSNPDVSGTLYVGLLCAYNSYSYQLQEGKVIETIGKIENVKIQESTISVDVGGTSRNEYSAVVAGLLCGQNEGTICSSGVYGTETNKCSVKAAAQTKYQKAAIAIGGLVGTIVGGSVCDVYVHDTIVTAEASANYRKNLFGKCKEHGTILFNAGGVAGESSTYGSYSSDVNITRKPSIKRALGYRNDLTNCKLSRGCSCGNDKSTYMGAILGKAGGGQYENCYSETSDGKLIGNSGDDDTLYKVPSLNADGIVHQLNGFGSNGWIAGEGGHLKMAKAEELSMDSADVQTTYFVGEPLNLRGLLVEAVKNDAAESRIEITGGYRVSGYDPNTPGTQTITVSYGKISGTYEVTVKEPEVCEIIIAETPKKTIYHTGDTLETAGLRVMAKYTDGTAKSLSEADVTVADVDMSIVGDEVLVMVTYGDCSTTFTISIFEKCAHDGTLNSVQTLPTCTEGGYTTYTCTKCGHSYVDDYVDALGHSEETIPCKDATCTETGLTEGKKCSVCGEILVEQEVIAVLNHSEEILPGKNATCTETGLTEGKKCSVCGEILVAQEVIAVLGHRYETVVTAPTCTEQGYTTYTCACGYSYVDDYVDALGHSEEILPGKDATCTETGLTEGKKCSVCGETLVEQEVIAALGHSEEILPGKDATCTETGLTEGKKCSVCGETLVAQEVIAVLGHRYETVVTAPTCTEQGYTTYTCACGYSYVDDYVDALGHSEEILPGKDATCTETGLTEGKKCSVCGEILMAQEVIAALGHNYEPVVTEPTYTTQGYTTHTCVNCGDSYVDSYTAPLVPETDVKVTVGTVSGNAGDTVEVYLTLEKAPALKILAISQIVYDTEHLTFVSGQWLRDDSFTDTFSKKNMNGLQLFEENTDVNGEIFKMTFTINADAPAGEYAVSCVVTAKQTDENGDDQDVLIAMESGKVIVKDYLLGDADGNEKVNTDDAIYLLYNIMFGDGDYPVNQKCDFDGNGIVNTDDAIYLLYHVMFGETDYPLHG